MKLDTLDERIKPLAEQLITKVAEAGTAIIITSCRRTIAEQNKLYAQGRTTSGQIVTRARGGQSPHNFGLAFDVVPLKDGKADWNAPTGTWEKIGEIGKGLGLTWGGDFKSIQDRPHFELPIWKEVLLAWQRGEIDVA